MTTIRDDIGIAALIGALFTVLAFQELRIEGYETEKAALLLMFGALLLYSNAKSPLMPDPVFIGVLIVLLATTLSTVLSLSPTRSFWGSDDRRHGLLTLVVYVLIFLQAKQNVSRLVPKLLPVLVCCALPMSLFAIQSHFGLGVLRPGSTTGNPNYLSSWLVLSLIGLPSYWRGQSRRVQMFLGVTMLCIIMALVLAASRGALAALGAGIATALLLWTATTRSRRGLISVSIIVGVLTAAIGVGVQLAGSSRIFQIDDPFRMGVWASAVDVFGQAHVPLTDVYGTPDTWARFRHIVGYGPDMIAQLQSRVGDVPGFPTQEVFINSFHNFIFETWATTGTLGLVGWLIVYIGIIYVALKALGLLRLGALPPLLIGLGLGIVVGNIVVNLIYPAPPSALFPLGTGLGLVFGLWIWLIYRTVHYSPKETSRTSQHQAMLIGLSSAMVVRWVDVQFGFVQVASEPLWWVMLGLLAGIAKYKRLRTYEFQSRQHLLVKSSNLCRIGHDLLNGLWIWKRFTG